MLSFWDKIQTAIEKKATVICLGLDPDSHQIQKHYPSSFSGLFQYCCDVVDVAADHICSIKIQYAHFAALRAESVLSDICLYIREKHSDLPLILDAKRGDIPSTANFYVQECFVGYHADAVTLNGYLGCDAVAPFVEFNGATHGVFILCRTSNSGAVEIQDQMLVSGMSVAEHIAHLFSQYFSQHPVGFVVGATSIAMLDKLRDSYPHSWFLVPGIGFQGGDIIRVLRASKCQHLADARVICPVSRSILYHNDDSAISVVGQRARDLTKKVQAYFSEKDYIEMKEL